MNRLTAKACVALKLLGDTVDLLEKTNFEVMSDSEREDAKTDLAVAIESELSVQKILVELEQLL
jgi:predicted rRNA methylase YqxC with S4 and FtsJ domains